MGQQEIFQILKQNKNKWLDSQQIWVKLHKNVTKSCISNSLKKLRKHKEVHYKNKWNGINSATLIYRYKKK